MPGVISNLIENVAERTSNLFTVYLTAPEALPLWALGLFLYYHKETISTQWSQDGVASIFSKHGQYIIPAATPLLVASISSIFARGGEFRKVQRDENSLKQDQLSNDMKIFFENAEQFFDVERYDFAFVNYSNALLLFDQLLQHHPRELLRVDRRVCVYKMALCAFYLDELDKAHQLVSGILSPEEVLDHATQVQFLNLRAVIRKYQGNVTGATEDVKKSFDINSAQNSIFILNMYFEQKFSMIARHLKYIPNIAQDDAIQISKSAITFLLALPDAEQFLIPVVMHVSAETCTRMFQQAADTDSFDKKMFYAQHAILLYKRVIDFTESNPKKSLLLAKLHYELSQLYQNIYDLLQHELKPVCALVNIQNDENSESVTEPETVTVAGIVDLADEFLAKASTCLETYQQLSNAQAIVATELNGKFEVLNTSIQAAKSATRVQQPSP